MANHSPKKDNYVGKRTFAQAMEEEDPKLAGPPEEQPTARKQAVEGANPAAGNGGGEKPVGKAS